MDSGVIRSSAAIRANPRIVMAAFIAVWVCAFWPTFRQWTSVWATSPNYDFGIVLAVCTLVALFARARLQPAPDARWLVPLAGLSVAWLFAWLAGIAAVQQIIVVGWAWVAARTLYGKEQSRQITPAIAWLVFASQVWEYVSSPLQALVVVVVPPVMETLGLPSVVSGNEIRIQAGTFLVEEGCSGVKFLISMLAVTAILLYLHHFRRWHRVLLVSLAVAMALLANWFRVGYLIAVGQATQMQSPMMSDHATFGWIVFAVALIPIVLVARRLAGDHPPYAPAAAGNVPAGSRLAGATAVALAGPLLAAVIVLMPKASATSSAAVTGDWVDARPGQRSTFPGGLDLELRHLESPAGTVRLGRVHAPVPARPEGLEILIGALNPGNPRLFVPLERKGEIVTAGKRVIRFSEREMLESGGLRKVTRFWFDVGGRSYPESAVAKAALALGALLGTRFMTIQAVETECSTECTSARTLLDQFMSAGM